MPGVRCDIADERATVTLENQDQRNALTAEVATELRSALSEIESAAPRCVVLQGAGETFCAGGDIQSMRATQESDEDAETALEEFALPINRAVQAVYECEAPTVAKVDGAAFGAGAALAVACDVVLASEGARISFGFRQVGLSVDSGTSYLLSRLVGENTAKELVYTGELLGSERAEDLGLLNRVFPAEEFEGRAADVVDRIATGPTVALKQSKQLLETEHDSFDDAVEAEAEGLAVTVQTADHAEGLAAFTADREPEFRGE
ncbi:MAG: enoyl-CoA hydratase-related protein [Halovenus sp.]